MKKEIAFLLNSLSYKIDGYIMRMCYKYAILTASKRYTHKLALRIYVKLEMKWDVRP